MQGAFFLNLSARHLNVVSLPFLKTEPKGMRIGLTVSLVVHSALLAVFLCTASLQLPAPEVIPISVVTVGETETLGRQLSFPAREIGFRSAKFRNTPLLSQVEDAQTLVVAKLAQAPDESGVPSMQYPPRAAEQSNLPAEQEALVEREPNSVAPSQSPEMDERNLRGTAEAAPARGGGIVDFVEENRDEPPGLKITRRTDWQANPVEDSKLTYSAPGSAVRLTAREASSAGFAGTHFANGFGLNRDENSEPFGLAPTSWGANALAKSQRVDWTLINLKNFGVTAFGYQNEVGRNFEPFGQTKKEFATPGSSTMKAGGEVRVGAFALGFAQSSTTKLEDSALEFSAADEEAAITVNEASVTVDLPRLLPGQVSSGLVSKIVPTVWMTASDRQTPNSDQASTLSTSLGGTWAWNIGHASLGYWNYSSDGNGAFGAAWSGHGYDANLGAYYSSFGVDVGFSYGQSEDVAPSWQSAGALYSSSVTVSYTPDELPGIWATAAAGNYDHNAIAYGNTSSDLYGVSTNGEYWSIAAGLDVTKWFWSPELSESGADNGQRSSVKLLYRYTDALSLDNSAGTTRDMDSLVAMMIQRKF